MKNQTQHLPWQQGIASFIDAVASSNPTPGGGSVAGAAGALGCALIMMAASVTIKIKFTQDSAVKILNAHLDELLKLKEDFKNLILADAKAYEEVVRAQKLPKTSGEREASLQAALKEAAMVPVRTAYKIKDLGAKIQEIEPLINKVILSDVNCAKYLLKASLLSCAENINANLPYLNDEDLVKTLKEELNLISKF